MAYTTIIEYNNYLIDNKVNINIIDYIKEINKLEDNIDIGFIDDFLELVNKNDFCIHHDMLIKYGVLSENCTSSGHVKRMLDRYKFIEHQDYRLSHLGQPVPQGGTSTKIIYYLHPNTFKMCLMGSANTRKYANYYLYF